MSSLFRTKVSLCVLGFVISGAFAVYVLQSGEKTDPPVDSADGYSDSVASDPFEPSHALKDQITSPENITTRTDALTAIRIVETSQPKDLMLFIDKFSKVSPDNPYLADVFKAVVRKLASNDFAKTLDEALFNATLERNAAEIHHEYWNTLTLDILAEQQPELVRESLALVSALFTNELSEQIAPGLAPTESNSNESLASLEVTDDSGLLESIVAQANTNLGAALHSIQNQVPDATDREALTIDLLYSYREQDAEKALYNLAEVINSDINLGHDATIELGQLYVSEQLKQSPLEAFEWLRAHPNEELSSSTLDNVLLPWIAEAPDEAYSYLSQLNLTSEPNSNRLELAENIVLAFVLNDHTQTAVEWLNLQTDEEVVQRGNQLLAQLSTEP